MNIQTRNVVFGAAMVSAILLCKCPLDNLLAGEPSELVQPQTQKQEQAAPATGSPQTPVPSASIASPTPAKPFANAWETLQSMRAHAQRDPWGAVEKFGTPQSQQLFEKISGQMWTRIPSREGWEDFFASAVCSAVPGSDGRFLAVFHQPYCDVVLMMLWEKGSGTSDKEWRFSDMEVSLGDFVRQRGIPPFSMNPPWKRQLQLPVLSIALGSQQIFADVNKAFPCGATEQSPLRHWRSAFAVAFNPETLSEIRRSAGQSLENNEIQLLRFAENKDAVNASQEVLLNMATGKLDDVLSSAKETLPETAAFLRSAPDLWKNLHLGTFITGGDWFCVCLNTNPADSVLALFFRAEKKKQPVLLRVDFMNYEKFRNYMARKTQPT